MAALLLAGGSIAACGGSARSDGSVGAEPEARGPIDATKPDASVPQFHIGQSGEIRLPERQLHPRIVPACNANPDPCCRLHVDE